MSDEFDKFLDGIGLRKRIECYRAGPQAIEHAIECGLFAVAVPAAFGGVTDASGYNHNIWHFVLAGIEDRVLSRILGAHYAVCDEIKRYGTFEQQSLIFPALASGERIGASASMRGLSSVGAIDNGHGYLLHGHTVAWMKPMPTTLLTVGVTFAQQQWLALVQYDVLPTGRDLRYGRVFLDLHNVFVSYDALLRWRFH